MDLISKNDREELHEYMNRYDLTVVDGKIVPKKESLNKWKILSEYYDKRQLVRKILLNSAYGALLNEHMKFYDKRIGQSVTLCGRQIVRHMMSYINETVTGEYTHEGATIIYGDTDSCYFSAYPVLKSQIDSGELSWTKESVIELYDGIADMVNSSFPQFMERTFHAPRKNGEIIRAGREIVADRGLFLRKKRYAVNIYDKEGKRKDKDGVGGDVKVIGLEIKRSDTPKFIQEFLMRVLTMVLSGGQKKEIVEFIREFKTTLNTDEPWTLGSPKAANKITHYLQLEEKSPTGKANMPGHVRASINWNYLRNLNGDNYSMKITDGMKVIVCKLRDNPLKFTSIAYPVDELRLPKWFTELPFDIGGMTNSLVDDKIENIFGVLKWDLRSEIDTTNTFSDLFSFDV